MNSRLAASVSLLTPSGRGAVAVVAVEGCAAISSVDRYFRAANGLPLGEQLIGRIVYGHWSGCVDETTDGEDLVVCRRGDDRLEVHCHGGRQSSTRIVADLTAELTADLTNNGCTLIDADAWLGSHHDCPLTASAHRALAAATTLRTATILLDQYHGALRREIEAIDIALSRGRTSEASERIEHLLQYAELGRHLTQPWRVVIAGEPNVGKSSLINALVGYQRAIVFDQPGTTRDIVSSTTAIDGWPVELNDTAGFRKTTSTSEIEGIEAAGIALARRRLFAADLVVWVLDALSLSVSKVESSKNLALRQAQAVGVPLDPAQSLIVINKVDLADVTVDQDPPSVGTCAVSGAGIERLLTEIVTRLMPLIPPPDAAVPFTVQQFEVLQAALDAISNQDTTAARASLRPWLTGGIVHKSL